LVAERLTLSGPGAAHGDRKITALVAGMLAGADSIDDMDLLRHGGMDRLFAGVRAPSTLGTFLRCFTFGHVRQLDAVASGLLGNLAGLCPLLVPASSGVVFVDVDDTMRETHGYAKQGVAYGYNRSRASTRSSRPCPPDSAPVIAATRLRKGQRTPPAARITCSPQRWSPPAVRGWTRGPRW